MVEWFVGRSLAVAFARDAGEDGDLGREVEFLGIGAVGGVRRVGEGKAGGGVVGDRHGTGDRGGRRCR